jgi:Ser/Thr protein kinase RdoA (MazF antagonist)
VAGFGWIARRPGAAAGLGAPFATLPDWLADELGEPLQGLASAAHWAASVPIVQHATSELVERVGNAPACLVHGDLDLTHIFADGDTYSGLLDFGEIRGAYRCYDFGHFALEAPALLPLVLAGYRERQKLPNDAERQIALTALLIAARRVGRRLWLGRTPSASMTEALQRWSNLVGGHDD